jgi:hypothetical protein
MRRRLSSHVVWTPGLNRLAAVQALGGAADALVAVSLAGSLFFNLSPAASQDQVLLYLVVNMAPFALLAPLIGPAIDRVRGGYRFAAVALYVLRAVFAAALAFFLFQLTLYFFALALLIAAKAGGVTRQALVPGLVSVPDQLVAANSRLARITTVAGAVGGIIGAPLLVLTSPSVTLALACAGFLGAAALTMRLPSPVAWPEVDPTVEYVELHAPTIMTTAWAFAAVRAAVGFFVFGLAFALRRESEPAWMYGATVAAYGAGTFAGLVIAPVLRRRYGEDRLTAGSLIALAVVAAFGALGPSRPLVLIVSTVLGMAASVARQGFDAMVQSRAPTASRGRAFARFETAFQLAWVAGAILATAIGVPIGISLAVVAIALVPAAGLYARAIRRARAADRDAPHDPALVARRRLVEAEDWLRRDQPEVAVTELVGAVDLLRASGHRVDPELVMRLEQLRTAVLAGRRPAPRELAWAASRTNALVAGLPRQPTQSGSDASTDEDVTVHCDERRANVNALVDESSTER